MSPLHDGEALRQLGTEQIRPELEQLDEMSVDQLVELMCFDVRQVPDSLSRAQDAIADAVRGVVAQLERGGRLIYVGAGTAGRLGMLDAAEARPTFNVEPGQVIAVLAGGLNAFGVPIENAEDDFDGGREQMHELGLSDVDCVVGISASGRTPFVLGALSVARESGAVTVGLSCNASTPLSAAVNLPIEIVVGAELIAGSTRMNSGTAQKLVLNIISTATMVRLGKTYGNLMVDLRPTNEKLRDRSQRIVTQITGAGDDVVVPALEASQWRPKVAAAMITGNLTADEARQLLALHRGRLRPTLDSLHSPRDRSERSTWRRLGVAAAFVNGQLIPGDVALHGRTIAAVGLHGEGNGIAFPGFVDNQINGYAGIDLLHASVSEILQMGVALSLQGVVAYQPTLITSDFDQLREAVSAIDEARRLTTVGSRILGIHLEGPFLSPRRAGTHPQEHLREGSIELLDSLLTAGRITMVTIAPEISNALGLIEHCVRRGVVVSLGHSAATSEQAHQGFNAGATAVTHLFNAMGPMSARSPGLAGVALTREDIAVQLIADGVHVSDDMLRLAFACAKNRCSLVSDAIAAAGVHRDVVQLGDVTVLVRNGQARRVDGTLAGSISSMREGLQRLHRVGIDTLEALQAAHTNPARLIGVSDLAELGTGSRANFVILQESLDISHRVVDGEVVEVS